MQRLPLAVHGAALRVAWGDVLAEPMEVINMPIKNYTTKVPAMQSVAEIVGALVAHGAAKIQQDYVHGTPVSIAFAVETPVGPRGFKLPSNVDRVKAVLSGQKIKVDDAQAERIAWRILRDWVMAQMAVLETEIVAMDQVMLPYMMDASGVTIYELYQTQQLLLETHETEKGGGGKND